MNGLAVKRDPLFALDVKALIGTDRESVERRFWAKVDKNGLNGCWIWKGSTAHGYGQMSVGGKLVRAHRLAYELLVGPIPEGMTLDHLCRNRACVKPRDLEPIPMRENILRGNGLAAKRAKATHCQQGHPFDLVNTHFSLSGRRRCRSCKRIWTARQVERKA